MIILLKDNNNCVFSLWWVWRWCASVYSWLQLEASGRLHWPAVWAVLQGRERPEPQEHPGQPGALLPVFYLTVWTRVRHGCCSSFFCLLFFASFISSSLQDEWILRQSIANAGSPLGHRHAEERGRRCNMVDLVIKTKTNFLSTSAQRVHQLESGLYDYILYSLRMFIWHSRHNI